jgi:hypothetical protein
LKCGLVSVAIAANWVFVCLERFAWELAEMHLADLSSPSMSGRRNLLERK